MFITVTHCSLQQRVKRVRVEWYAQGRRRMEACGHFPLCPVKKGATGAEVPFHHRCRSRQIFGVRRILPEFPQTCPKSFLGNFCLQIFSHKYHEDLIWCNIQNRSSCVFMQTLGIIIWNQTTLGTIFTQIFRASFLPGYSFCKAFAKIFSKSKLLGVRSPAPLLFMTVS